MSDLIDKAITFATYRHKEQSYNNQAFIIHPMQVFKCLEVLDPAHTKEEMMAAAILHDVIEDCGVTHNELRHKFGENVANWVLELTKTSSNCFPMLHSKEAITIKFFDRGCNLFNIDSWTPQKQAKYLAKSIFWKKK